MTTINYKCKQQPPNQPPTILTPLHPTYRHEHMTVNTTDFMPRFIMRFYNRVSRNDKGDTMLIDESEPTELVDIIHTKYLIENGRTISDNDNVIMATVTSGTNGEPCTLVDVTSQVIPLGSKPVKAVNRR